jgi:ABC-type nitrate/sulfonate/bicarbonate transport system substrate-binding protein
MMKRSAVLATLGLVLVLAGAASPQSRPLKIRLGVHASIMGAADVIAIRQGYFKQAGLEVESRKFFLGKEGRDAMIAGAIDINATAPTPFLIGLDKGVPYTAVAVNSMICAATHIVTLKSSDINSVSQLRGRKIGLPKGTITEYVFLTRAAPSYGLKPGDFQVANIPDPKDMTPSLIEGDRHGLAGGATQLHWRARRHDPDRRGLLQVRPAAVHADRDEQGD